ncbi:G:T/U-mismatch repair DNA glycosylase [Bradyrhizobium japonicum]
MTFIETHPFNDAHPIPESTRTLVVGTAPPPRFGNPNCAGEGGNPLDFHFFYGSGKNRFWKFMNTIAKSFNTPLPEDQAPAAEYQAAACKFLVRHGIWMKDVLHTYARTPECSSFDKDIIAPQIQDLTGLHRVLDEHRQIERLAFTAEVAARWTFQSLSKLDLYDAFERTLADRKSSSESVAQFDASAECAKFAAPFMTPIVTAVLGGREIEFFQLPSPSVSSFPPKGVTDGCLTNIYKHVLFAC